MVVDCETVWSEVSNYLDGEVDRELRSAIEEHLRGCKRCVAVLAGTRNVVQLYGDERMLEVPLGFGHRLHRKLDDAMRPTRRSFLGWMVAAAAGVLVVGGFELARSLSLRPAVRSAHAQPGRGIPPDMMVLVYPQGKTFHRTGCTYLLDKKNLIRIAAGDAERAGYVPCTRCMKKYLTATARLISAGGESRS